MQVRGVPGQPGGLLASQNIVIVCWLKILLLYTAGGLGRCGGFEKLAKAYNGDFLQGAVKMKTSYFLRQ